MNVSNIFQKYLWIHVAVITLAILSFILTWRNIVTRVIVIAEIRGKEETAAEAWSHLTFKEKTEFFNLWMIVTILGNIFQIFGGLLAFFDADMVMGSHQDLTGIGCFLAWVNSIHYYERDTKYYTVVNTLRRSSSTLIRYMIGVMPIFFSFVFLGMALFWSNSSFQSISQATVTLFCLINTDSVIDFFNDTSTSYPLMSLLYGFTFMIFFVSCVQNIFIAIIQEAYQSLSKKPVKSKRMYLARSSDDEDYKHSSEENSSRKQSRRNSNQNLKELWRQESKKHSKRLFRQIVTQKSFDMPAISTARDKHTEIALRHMHKLGKEITELALKMKSLAMPLEGISLDMERLDDYLQYFFNSELPESVLNR